MRVVLVCTLAVAGVLGAAPPAAAQVDTRASVSAGVAFLRWLDFESFISTGASFDFVKPGIFGSSLPEWAIVGDVGFYHEGDTPETDSSFMGGVRYTKKVGQWNLFAQGQVGGVHWTIPDGGSNSGVAFVPGGGAVVMFSERFGLKAQVDYFVMKWNNSVEDGDLLRVFGGLEIKLGKKK